jgi:glutamyl-tRNA reductase
MTLGTERLIGIGFSHLLAPLACRERAMVPEAEAGRVLRELSRVLGAREAVLLSTCSRLELYAAADDPDRALAAAREWFVARAGAEVEPCLTARRGEEALGHLFRVAAGLDSWILGESEILGQVKRAYEAARAAGLTGATLNRAFQSAAAAGKSARAKTGLQHGIRSIGGAAAVLARRIFGETRSGTVVVFGAGEIARATVRHLAAKNFSKVFVANRTVAKARELAAEIGGLGIGLDEGLRLLAQAEIAVFSASCERPLLDAAALTELSAGRRRPLFLLDLGLPRNVAPDCADLPDAYLYNLDDLKGVVARSVEGKAAEGALAEALVAEAARACAAELEKAEARRPAAAAA